MIPRHRPAVLLFCAVMALALTNCGGSAQAPLTPNPGPTPTPAASAPPTAFVCPLPPSSKANPNDCFEGRPSLGIQVNSAIDFVIATRPELFNLAETNGGSPRVLDRDNYWKAVKAELERQGVCTIIEKEEFAVKTTNDFNEQWNLWTSAGFVRRRYVTTCAPSWF